MTWFSKRGAKATKPRAQTSRVPEGLWTKCEGCDRILRVEELRERLGICSHCSHSHALSASERVAHLCDPGSFELLDLDIVTADPLEFKDQRRYVERVKTYLQRAPYEAFLSGRARVSARPVQLGSFEFGFMGGSMGSVVGEKVTRMFERGHDEKTPVIIVSSSGGARMQEGIFSLMQMAKTCAALQRFRAAGQPYISILVHPTTGGVAASFAMLGDVILAEPKALIGFAGPRVIEQTIRQKLPAGFQRAEFLLEHGMIDGVIERPLLRETVARICGILGAPALPKIHAKPARRAVKGRSTSAAKRRAK